MAARPINEPFDILGEWFLPENSGRAIAGRLLYTPERTELQLNEAFQPLRGTLHAGDKEQSYPVVYGTTINGDAMTLLKTQRLGLSLNFGSGGMRQPERLISSWLLVGAHMPPDFAYPDISFRVPALQVWLSRKIIEQSLDKDPATGRLSPTYRVLLPDEEATPIPLIDATLHWGIRWNANCDAFTSISVGVSAWVTIRPSSPKSIEWYFEQQSKIATMLAFLGGVPMSPDCIEASIGEPHHKVSVLVAMRDAHYCSYKNLHDFFMPRGAMCISLSEVVDRWFEMYPKVHMPSQLALSVLASPKLWLHVEFLSLMQALEGFHRGLFDGNYMDEAAYDSVKKTLGDAIPTELASDHKDALRSRIRYGNQISLRKRLDSLSGLLSEPIRKIILGANGNVPHSWIDTRNYYTHWDEQLRNNVLDGQAMYYANVRMHHLLRALYVQLMGVPQKAIIRSLSNASDTSQHLLQLNTIERRGIDPNDRSGVIITVTEEKADNVSEQEPASDHGAVPPSDKAEPAQ